MELAGKAGLIIPENRIWLTLAKFYLKKEAHYNSEPLSGEYRARTGHLYHAMVALYQMS